MSPLPTDRFTAKCTAGKRAGALGTASVLCPSWDTPVAPHHLRNPSGFTQAFRRAQSRRIDQTDDSQNESQILSRFFLTLRRKGLGVLSQKALHLSAGSYSQAVSLEAIQPPPHKFTDLEPQGWDARKRHLGDKCETVLSLEFTVEGGDRPKGKKQITPASGVPHSRAQFPPSFKTAFQTVTPLAWLESFTGSPGPSWLKAREFGAGLMQPRTSHFAERPRAMASSQVCTLPQLGQVAPKRSDWWAWRKDWACAA